MILDSRYQLLEKVTSGPIESHWARHVRLGHSLLLHFYSDDQRANRTPLLDRIDQLNDADQRLFLDAGSFDGRPYVVSLPLPGFSELDTWLTERIPATAAASFSHPASLSPAEKPAEPGLPAAPRSTAAPARPAANVPPPVTSSFRPPAPVNESSEATAGEFTSYFSGKVSGPAAPTPAHDSTMSEFSRFFSSPSTPVNERPSPLSQAAAAPRAAEPMTPSHPVRFEPSSAQPLYPNPPASPATPTRNPSYSPSSYSAPAPQADIGALTEMLGRPSSKAPREEDFSALRRVMPGSPEPNSSPSLPAVPPSRPQAPAASAISEVGAFGAPRQPGPPAPSPSLPPPAQGPSDYSIVVKGHRPSESLTPAAPPPEPTPLRSPISSPEIPTPHFPAGSLPAAAGSAVGSAAAGASLPHAAVPPAAAPPASVSGGSATVAPPAVHSPSFSRPSVPSGVQPGKAASFFARLGENTLLAVALSSLFFLAILVILYFVLSR